MNDDVKNPDPPHAVARLRLHALAHSATRPHLDRIDTGQARKPRCAGCRLAPTHCACASRPRVPTRAGVCLVMSEFEPLKPTNTGWLVADVVPDTHAFAWSRTSIDPALLALLADPAWAPVVVFPAEFSAPERVIAELPRAEPASTRRPLFVLFDGTWSQARKAFRKSPWLERFPVLGLSPGQVSRYRLRRSWHEHHFCTAEVAALCLEMAGDRVAARHLQAWLDVFSERYLRAKQSVPVDAGHPTELRLRTLRL